MSKAISTSHFAADAAEMHLHAYNAAFYELGLNGTGTPVPASIPCPMFPSGGGSGTTWRTISSKKFSRRK